MKRKKFGGIFDTDAIKCAITEKQKLTAQDGFWADNERAQKVLDSIKRLKAKIEPWEALKAKVDDLRVLCELAEESGDAADAAEVESSYKSAKAEFDKLNILHLLNGEVDENDTFLTIHSGSGGTEAEDWAVMLLRMYSRYCEKHNFKVEVLDMLEAEGGIKSVTLQVSGDYAYGKLKGEAGVHRLVRISPFDANARRHTSFASVYVYPVLDDSIEVEIRPEDLRVDTYRSGGKGGQHLNKTDSAVRFTHLPTGIVVSCQSERSQIFNRQACMNMLRSKLYEYYREQKEKENQKFAGVKKEITWGSQIRSYVFQPYTMVKDHRTKCEATNIQAVMDGELDKFIDEYLVAKSAGTISEDEEDEGAE